MGPARVVVVGYPGMGKNAPNKYAYRCDTCNQYGPSRWNESDAKVDCQLHNLSH